MAKESVERSAVSRRGPHTEPWKTRCRYDQAARNTAELIVSRFFRNSQNRPEGAVFLSSETDRKSKRQIAGPPMRYPDAVAEREFK
jgi:hypothetical protein